MRFLFLFISLVVCENIFSQNQNNIWYFGGGAGVTFNSGKPVALTNSIFGQIEGTAVMSDNNGNFLFYTDGLAVWNRDFDTMPHGKGLLGGQSSTQSALIVPKPGDCNIYYIFTVPAAYSTGNTPLSYSVLDMRLNGGLGDISSKNISLYLPVPERLTGTLQSNGIDYWVVAQEYGSNAFLAYSVTSNGVNSSPVISKSGPVLNQISGDPNTRGYMKFSPDGSKLCYANTYDDLPSQLFDFDNATGIVSNNIPLTDFEGYGVEFSPDNSKLYIATQFHQPYIVTQYDLSAGSPTAIQNSAVRIDRQIYSSDSSQFQIGGALELGPDNKIYVALVNQYILAVIDKPNLKGAKCNYLDTAIVLNNLCEGGLPNNIKKLSSSCLLPIILINFTSTLINNAVKLQWQTAQEINSSYFSIERSADGLNFSPISRVNAAGTSTGLRSYTFTDLTPFSRGRRAGNEAYYRLKEVDKDGRFTYSKVLLVKPANINSFTILQNPVQNTLQLQNAQSGSYSIYDFSGRKIQTGNAQSGSQSISITSLASGMYFLQVITSNGIVISKMFEKK